MALLDSIKNPADLRNLDDAALATLADEIRARIIEVTARNGGHVGPNLGVVELTLALHRVFETPSDEFVFDVSHQAYVHKLLTGRNGPGFDLLRQSGGLCGFMNRAESPHDAFGAGHAGTAFSAAVGLAAARDRQGRPDHVVAVLGDAAFTCGITLEAMNNVKAHCKRLIIVLNDNEWAIDRNVGALSRYFNELITAPTYNRLNRRLRQSLMRMPGGERLVRFGSRWKRETKDFFLPSSLFETFGIRYIGPIDGHDRALVEHYLRFCKEQDKPVLLHVITQKGRGLDAAVKHPEKFHGASPFDPVTGESLKPAVGTAAPPNYQDVFGRALVRFAAADQAIVGVTAAMPSGTGLSLLRESRPEQYFDVGIAEEHATVFAAALATRGVKPVVAIYSTFLQRAFDSIVHDVALQKLPVVFCLDRAGLSPNDGATHHGLFDIGFLGIVPGAVVMQPRDENALVDMLWTALQRKDGPTFIRYPRGAGIGVPVNAESTVIPLGRAEVLREGRDGCLWALGPWVQDALAVADRLQREEGLSVCVVDARFAKPIDRELLQSQAAVHPAFVTFEDHVLSGGLGAAVAEALSDMGICRRLCRIAWPNRFIEHGSSVKALREANGLGAEAVYGRVLRALKG